MQTLKKLLIEYERIQNKLNVAKLDYEHQAARLTEKYHNRIASQQMHLVDLEKEIGNRIHRLNDNELGTIQHSLSVNLDAFLTGDKSCAKSSMD